MSIPTIFFIMNEPKSCVGLNANGMFFKCAQAYLRQLKITIKFDFLKLNVLKKKS